MTEILLTALTSGLLCLAVCTGLYALRVNWALKQQKDQIEFLTDMLAKQALEINNKSKSYGLMR